MQKENSLELYITHTHSLLYMQILMVLNYSENVVLTNDRNELDKWILSELNSLILAVEKNYNNYEPTAVARLIQSFVINKLSNWYIRLSRRRFWKGKYTNDKISAYQTLYECLQVVAIIGSPIAPFFMDKLFQDLNSVGKLSSATSVHLSDFPKANTSVINVNLEKRMALAQNITSLVLSLRKKEDKGTPASSKNYDTYY